MGGQALNMGWDERGDVVFRREYSCIYGTDLSLLYECACA